MSVLNRFFGKMSPDDTPGDLVAEPNESHSPALQVVFADNQKLDPAAITAAMRAYHPSMAQARFEVAADLNEEGKLFGLAGWGEHIIKVVGFDIPMPEEVVELCVAPAHYTQSLKEQARAHQSHALLWYAGRADSVVEQFVALAAFAGVLAPFGALAVLNEAGRTSFPAAALSGQGVEGDMMELLQSLPLPILYCGFVKYDVPDERPVWMRPYGAYVLGLPDFAAYTNGHHEAEHYFEMFDNIMRYMLNSDKRLAAGHTMQIGANDYLRCRAPTAEESWLESEGEILLVEVISADQINR